MEQDLAVLNAMGDVADQFNGVIKIYTRPIGPGASGWALLNF